MNIKGHFIAALGRIPAPGTGCHAALLGVANLGIMAGCDDSDLLDEIRAHIPAGARRVPDSEIMDAIRRAHKDTVPMMTGGRRAWNPRPIPPPRRTQAELVAMVLKSPEAADASFESSVLKAGGDELDPCGADVFDFSPVRLEPYSEALPYTADMITLLASLYQPEDLLFIGSRESAGRESIRSAASWIRMFQALLAHAGKCPADERRALLTQTGLDYPLICPNPLTGEPGEKKDGSGMTFRGDSCIRDFRFIVVESDSLPMQKQGAMLKGLCSFGFRIAALIHSGNKSVHAWLKIDQPVSSLAEWDAHIRKELFPLLKSCGADGACSNPSRLSRLPGIYRADRGNWQRLLYLAPEGGAL